jgi:hypothetical protein
MHIYRDMKATDTLPLYEIGINDMETKIRNVSIVRSICGLSFRWWNFSLCENIIAVFIFIYVESL